MTEKPKSADPTKPYWIVMLMSKGVARINMRAYFRHATLEQAEAEAERLSKKCVGKRFSVFAIASSFRVEKDKSND